MKTDGLFDGKSIVEQKQMISPPHRQVVKVPGHPVLLQNLRDASSPDQLNGEIDFRARPPHSEIS